MAETYLKDNILICNFEKRVDAANIHEVEEEINKLLSGAKKVIFNIGETSYISSVFLNLALTIAKTIGNDNFCIVNAKSRFVKDILSASGFNKIINVSENESIN